MTIKELRELLKKNAPNFYPHYRAYKINKINKIKGTEPSSTVQPVELNNSVATDSHPY